MDPAPFPEDKSGSEVRRVLATWALDLKAQLMQNKGEWGLGKGLL